MKLCALGLGAMIVRVGMTAAKEGDGSDESRSVVPHLISGQEYLAMDLLRFCGNRLGKASPFGNMVFSLACSLINTVLRRVRPA